jgi:hypothetical protein
MEENSYNTRSLTNIELLDINGGSFGEDAGHVVGTILSIISAIGRWLV